MDSGLGLSMLALFKVIVYKYKVNKQNINKQSLCNRLRKIAIARFVLQKLLMFLDLKKGFTIIWEGSNDLNFYLLLSNMQIYYPRRKYKEKRSSLTP